MDAHDVGKMARSEFVLENCEQFLKARPSILVTDCKSLYDASTDKRLAIELATVKAKAVSGETDLRWIDARYQIADCLTKHASRKSESVLQKVLNEAQWRITAEEDMLDRRKREREIRNSSVKSIPPTTENWLRKLYTYSKKNYMSTEDKHDTNHINNKYNDTNNDTRKMHNT